MDEVLVSVPLKVEVTFFVPGCGAVKETYDLDHVDDMVCWSANERFIKAIQTHVKTIEATSISEAAAEEIAHRRAAMRPSIEVRLSEMRVAMARGAASGQ